MTELAYAFDTLEDALPVPRGTHDHVAVSRMLAEPARTIAPVNPSDPARIGYPPTFVFEIALRTSSVRRICEEYNISREEWDLIRFDETFLGDLNRAAKIVAEEGMSFKIKAKLQAEELLKTSWRTIHDPATPPNVRADLIKATMRWAEYDTPPNKEQTASGHSGRASFMINMHFNGPVAAHAQLTRVE